jgi:NAD(P)H-nitrite reductase large subunit
LKSAYGLSAHSKDIRVIVKSGHVLSQVLDRNSASYFEDWIGRKGISIMTGLEATEIAGDNSVKGVVLDDGKMLDCEMVVVGKGVQPNVEIAKESNLNIDEGITVDDHLRTNIDYVYSAGDVAQAKDLLAGEARINALWPNAVEQGKVAGLNMAGAEVVYDGSMTMNSVEFFGLPVISMGITRPKEGFEEIICEDKDKGIYKKIVMKGGVVVGMIFIKDIRSAGVVGALIRKRINASAIKEDLLDENFDFAKIAGLIAEHRNEFKQEEFKDIILTY